MIVHNDIQKQCISRVQCALCPINAVLSSPCSRLPTPWCGPAWATASCPTGPWTSTASWPSRTCSPRTQAFTSARAPTCLPWTRAMPSSTCQVCDPWRCCCLRCPSSPPLPQPLTTPPPLPHPLATPVLAPFFFFFFCFASLLLPACEWCMLVCVVASSHRALRAALSSVALLTPPMPVCLCFCF